MISLITGLDVADVEQKPSVTASPMVQLALDTTSWCVLQLAPETNDCVICYQLPSSLAFGSSTSRPIFHYPILPYTALQNVFIT